MVRHRSLPVVLTVIGVVGALAALARIPDEPTAEVDSKTEARLIAHFEARGSEGEGGSAPGWWRREADAA